MSLSKDSTLKSLAHLPYAVEKPEHEDSLYSKVSPFISNIKSKRKVKGVPQSQTAALPRHQDEEETDKTKQAQIEQTYEKH